MKKLLFLMLFCSVALVMNAQTDAKYLQGAVPEVDGKVIFTKSIAVNKPIADSKLFDLLEQWAQSQYPNKEESKRRILLNNPEKKTIACLGDDPLVFKRSALSLDAATMSYQLILEVINGKCEATIRNIRYEYNESGRNAEIFPAEVMITDKFALNKKGDKLNSYYNKFRVSSIDSINAIFDRIDIYLNGVKVTAGAVDREYQNSTATTTPSVATPAPATAPVAIAVETPVATTTTGNSLAGFRQIAADKIPGNIVKLLNDAVLITSGTANQTNVMTASWGGLGVFWQKPIAISFLNPTRYSVSTMDNGDTYTISFYTEAYKDALEYCGTTSGRDTDKIKGSGLTPIKTPSGATAFAEAWMIFECKKVVAQQIFADAVKVDVPEEWKKNGYHKIYIGEILNVWVK